jgi:hypothetical protein
VLSPTPAPEPRRQEPPLSKPSRERPAAPPPGAQPEPEATPAAEPEAAEVSPTPTPDDEPETTTDAPAEELRRIAGELKTESERLYTLYERFLEQKEDGGAELTEADEQLLEELEVFEDAAARFNRQFQEGFLKRLRRRSSEDRTQLVRRGEQLAERGRAVDGLMAQVQPGPEVQQAWQEIRRRWKRAAEVVTRFQ